MDGGDGRSADLSGGRILEYRLERKLGEGGMGSVYLGVHGALGQKVAIKILAPELSRHEEIRERFLQEARIQIALQHPAIVQVHTASTEGGALALVMEYVDGPTLGEALASRGALPLDEALPLIGQILAAVGYAHGRGVVHRDLKPSNLLLTAGGAVKVTDFGIAKVIGGTKLTRTGTVMGSAEYMSPEQVVGSAEIDHRSDLYSLGATFHEMLTGKAPFEGLGGPDSDSDYLVREAHVRRPAPDPRTVAPELPEHVALALVHALAKEPADRPGSAAEFWAELSGDAETPAPKPVPEPEIEAGGPASQERVTRRDEPLKRRKRRRGCAGLGLAAVAVALVALVGLGGAVGGGLYWNWARTKTVYCASVVERWGVQECDVQIGARQQKHRESTHALTVKRGQTLRVDRINGLGFPQNSLEYVYGDDGRLDEILERNDRDKVTGRWIYSDDLGRRDRKRRNGGATHQAELLEYDGEGFLVQVLYRTDAGGFRDSGYGVYGRRFERDDRGRATRRSNLGIDGSAVENQHGVGFTEYDYDTIGNVVEESQHRSDGVLWLDPHYQRAIRRAGFDEHGNLASETVFDAREEPLHRHRYRVGPHEIRHSYDLHGRRVRTDYLDDDGEPVVSGSGYASVLTTFDDRGRVVESAYLDRNGGPTHSNAGVHRAVTTHSDDGLTKAYRWYDAEGRPHHRRSWGVEKRIRSDEWGRTLETRHLGAGGTPMLNDEGYATVKYLYDDEGGLIAGAYQGIHGEPVLTTRCVAHVTYDRDGFGDAEVTSYSGLHGEPARNSCGEDEPAVKRSVRDEHGRLIETSYFDVDGEIFEPFGYARVRWRRDEAGRTVETSYYDERDRLRRDKGVVATRRVTHDARGLEYETSYFDHNGKRTLANGASATRTLYDEAGRRIERSHLDARDRPTESSGGYATARWTYDLHGNTLTESHFDEHGDPVSLDAGYSAYRRRFDDRGREVETVYLDPAGERVSRDGGYASVSYQRDDRGRVIETRYLDSSGAPVVADVGYAILRTSLDARGNASETAYFGVDDRPLEIDDGWARIVEEHDKWGDRVAGAIYGADGQPTEHAESRHSRFTNEYDDLGRRVEWAFFDADGKPMRRKASKCHRTVYAFDSRGNKNEYTYWDEDGDPCNAWWGYHRLVKEYDDRGKMTRETIWDRRGKKLR